MNSSMTRKKALEFIIGHQREASLFTKWGWPVSTLDEKGRVMKGVCEFFLLECLNLNVLLKKQFENSEDNFDALIYILYIPKMHFGSVLFHL